MVGREVEGLVSRGVTLGATDGIYVWSFGVGVAETVTSGVNVGVALFDVATGTSENMGEAELGRALSKAEGVADTG